MPANIKYMALHLFPISQPQFTARGHTRDAEGRIFFLDAGFWRLDAGYWILDTGFWYLFWILHATC